MIGYVMVGSNDLDEAERFYGAILPPLGMMRNDQFSSDARRWYWTGEMDRPMFVLATPRDEQPATVGNGSMVALQAPSRAVVDQVHAQALGLGAKDEGAPGERGPGFYAAYFRDLDGNKLCAFRFGPPDA